MALFPPTPLHTDPKIMIVQLTADLVTEKSDGKTVLPLDPMSVPEPHRSKLTAFLHEVRDRLTDAFPQSKVPSPGTSPSATLANYRFILEYAFNSAVQKLDLGPGNAGGELEITLGSYVVGSVWIPTLKIWDARPGAAQRLNLVLHDLPAGSDFSADTPLFLNVRPVISEDSDFCTYELQLAGDRRTTGVAIFLGAARSKPRSLSLVPQRSDASTCSCGTSRFAEVAEGLWVTEGPIQTECGCITVEILFDGDPPHVRGATALVDGAANPREAPRCPSPDAPFPAPPRVVDAADLNVLRTYAYPRDAFSAYRSARVHASTTHGAAQRFFLALDEATQPGAPESEVDVNTLGGLLMDQYLRRAEAYHFDEPLELSGPGLVAKADMAAPAGQLIRGLMKKHLGDDGSGCNSAIRRAFECFASGELTVVDTLGAPNGTNMFSFAELALVHIAAGIDADVWLRLFRIFGHAAQIFAGCYHKCGAKRTHCSYRVENNPTGDRAPSDYAREDLWSLWNVPDPRCRYDQLIYAALKDDVLETTGTDPGRPTLAIHDFGCGSTRPRHSI